MFSLSSDFNSLVGVLFFKDKTPLRRIIRFLGTMPNRYNPN